MLELQQRSIEFTSIIQRHQSIRWTTKLLYVTAEDLLIIVLVMSDINRRESGSSADHPCLNACLYWMKLVIW